jgi:hypothetical protein
MNLKIIFNLWRKPLMNKSGRIAILATGLSLAMGISAANAALIDVEATDKTKDFTLTDNNSAGWSGITGQVGGTVVATTDQPIKLTFEYYFKEASYTNGFYVNGKEVFNTTTSKQGDTFSTIWNGGDTALDFYFQAGSVGKVTNEGNDADSAKAFWTYWDGTDLILALDDSGNRNDNDYDDMIIKVRADAVGVPEPSTIALFGLGILGLGLARRRAK